MHAGFWCSNCIHHPVYAATILLETDAETTFDDTNVSQLLMQNIGSENEKLSRMLRFNSLRQAG